MRRIAFLTSFESLNATLSIRKDFFKHLTKNFKKIYIIDIDKLIYFPRLKTISYFEKKRKDKINFPFPSNIKLIKPDNSKDFFNFAKKNKLLVINNFNKSFFNLKIYFLLKKCNIPQIRIDNLGGVGMPVNINIKNPIKFLNYQLLQNFSAKILLPVLTFFGFLLRGDIHFHSKRKELEKAKKSFLMGYLLKQKLSLSKEYKLINSRSYDALLENKVKIEKKYIVHLDAEMNGRHEIETRGKLKLKDIKSHYHHLRIFLNKLSQDFNKPVVVCIHPNIKKKEVAKFIKSKMLKGFKVAQHKTRYYIYKSFLVTNFDTSAIVDAIILKKYIIGLWSRYMDNNQIEHSKTYPCKAGYMRINFENYKYDKTELKKLLNDNITKYSNFIKDYHCHKKGKSGLDQVINVIKKRYKCK